MDFTLIVVDDDLICLLVCKRIIKMANFHLDPQMFTTVAAALSFIDYLSSETQPVLLFLDINMPLTNGWDMLEIIHRDDFKQNVYVVMVSSSIDSKDKEKAFSFSKVIEFIEKPFTTAALQKLKLILPWKK